MTQELRETDKGIYNLTVFAEKSNDACCAPGCFSN